MAEHTPKICERSSRSHLLRNFRKSKYIESVPLLQRGGIPSIGMTGCFIEESNFTHKETQFNMEIKINLIVLFLVRNLHNNLTPNQYLIPHTSHFILHTSYFILLQTSYLLRADFNAIEQISNRE